MVCVRRKPRRWGERRRPLLLLPEPPTELGVAEGKRTWFRQLGRETRHLKKISNGKKITKLHVNPAWNSTACTQFFFSNQKNIHIHEAKLLIMGKMLNIMHILKSFTLFSTKKNTENRSKRVSCSSFQENLKNKTKATR